ncbi:ATP-binding protein [Flavobacterium sp. 120]|uniref:ATP-binding protein n=1 Tax=Flavobacterium sp. 120 TaxID=2135626 RepID=UPI000EAC2C40|nr:ATP-binding protein [Flavobacterium sp. 120]RKS15777.1 hypothetical protein C8C87_3140 [Flavobacterium sp. 120]
MTKLKICVPNDHTSESWFSFINDSLKLVNLDFDDIIIDLNTITFLDTDDIVALACLLDSFANSGKTIKFENGDDSLLTYLENIKFKNYWNPEFNRDRFTVTNNDTTLCLWHISKEMIVDYTTYATRYYKGIFKDKDLVLLSLNLTEVFNNIFDHSYSSVNGYIITEYFPKKNILSFSVCDFGIGIAESMNRYNKSINKMQTQDSIAIKGALITGVSSHSTPQNRGFGLGNVLDFTENYKGALTIFSNNGYLCKIFGEEYDLIETEFNFLGTLIKVEINTLELEKIDEEDEIFDW